MISSKHLVTLICLLLLAASGKGWAASSSTDGASTSTTDSSTTDAGASSTTGSHKHHHKHHAGTTTAATTNAAPSAPSATTTESSAETPTAPSSKKGNGKSTPAPTAAAAPATASATTPAHGSKKKHGVSTAANATTPATANAPDATSASTPVPGSTTSAATTANGQPGAIALAPGTTAKTGRHRHHGKTAAVATTPPPIVMPPASVPLAPQTTVTLPVSAPLSGVKLPATSSVPTVMTGLPVARPGTGTTATLPIGLVHNPTPSVLTNFPFTDYTLRRRTQTYPWKTSIVTTVFWIGEDASAVSSTTNHSSAWDIYWEHNNGGADDQYDLNGYASAQHASMLNPFYVALPFNDLAYPEEAERWLPANWPRPPRRDGKPVSACQHRWVEIKNRAGRVCFAQWEDVGPLVTDNAEYVFGPERPSARAGLDVSPAVAKYLGIDSTAYTSWRFVDDEDVQPGMWLRYDEQALLFRALKEQMHGSSTPRIQDLSEPVPDDSDNDSNQKKAGAARG